MFYLSSNGIKCPLPLRNNNKLFSEIIDKPASILTLSWTEHPTPSVTEKQAYQLGLILRKIHNISTSLEINRKKSNGVGDFPQLIKNSKATAENFSKDLSKNIYEEYDR